MNQLRYVPSSKGLDGQVVQEVEGERDQCKVLLLMMQVRGVWEIDAWIRKSVCSI